MIKPFTGDILKKVLVLGGSGDILITSQFARSCPYFIHACQFLSAPLRLPKSIQRRKTRVYYKGREEKRWLLPVS